MFKKLAIISVLIISMVFFAVFSSGSFTGLRSAIQSAFSPTRTANTSQSMLSVGILELEDSDLAITKEQAQTLLPLWKAVSSLSKDSNTTATEMTALYQQIEENLTSAQIQAIQQLSLSPSDLSALVQQYNMQNSSTKTHSALNSTTSSNQMTVQNANVSDITGLTGAGGDLNGITGLTGQTTTSQTTTTVKSTPSSASKVTNLNIQFASAVVSLLQNKAA